MRKNAKLILSMAVPIIMIVGGIGFLAAPHNMQAMYREGNAMVSFQGASENISYANSNLVQSWNIFSIENGTASQIPLSWASTPLVKDPTLKYPYLVQVGDSSSVSLGSITQPTLHGLEQSAVIVNKASQNESFLVSYKVVAPAGNLVVNGFGFHNEIRRGVSAHSIVAPLSKYTYSVSLGSANISWLSANSIFMGGYIVSNQTSNTIYTLYQANVPANGTFTIDPSISSYPVTGGAFSIFDGSYNLLVQYGMSVAAPDYYLHYGTNWHMQAATTILPISSQSYGVNEIVQNFAWQGDDLGNTPSSITQAIELTVQNMYWQEHSTSSDLSTVLNALLTIMEDVASLYGVPFFNPFALVLFSSTSNSAYNSVTNTQDAGYSFGPNGYESPNILSTVYYTDLIIPHTKYSMMFGLDTNTNYFNYYPSSNAIEYLTYTSTVSVTEGGNHAPIYTGSSTIGFNMGLSP